MDNIALGCVAVLGLLLFGLGLSVSMMRFHERTNSGCADDPANLLHELDPRSIT